MSVLKLELNEKSAHLDLREIAERVKRAKKCVIITGAGISCSGGIPDFRSPDGLYEMIQERYPGTFRSGKDLFDADLLHSDLSIEAFYAFMGLLKEFVVNATPTPTHYFIKKLFDLGKLMRVYTQNIDNLEELVGLNVNWLVDVRGAQVVQLHGTMEQLKCNSCTESYVFVEEYCQIFKQGEAPQCPACEERESERRRQGKRKHTVGKLKPSILLYGDSHPQGEQIGQIAAKDEEKADCLIIMGTSLRIPGVKRLIRQFSKAVHGRNGTVIFVNATDVAKKEWDTIIDYQIIGTSDEWVQLMEMELEQPGVPALTPNRKRRRTTEDEPAQICVDNRKSKKPQSASPRKKQATITQMAKSIKARNVKSKNDNEDKVVIKATRKTKATPAKKPPFVRLRSIVTRQSTISKRSVGKRTSSMKNNASKKGAISKPSTRSRKHKRRV